MPDGGEEGIEAVRECLYLVGYEGMEFGKVFEMVRDAVTLWAFIFPVEWHWHLVMITYQEYERYVDSWNIGGTPKWSEIPGDLQPPRKDFSKTKRAAGVWVIGVIPGENPRPGHAELHYNDIYPEQFQHEFSHYLCMDLGQSNYNTIHFDYLYHCGAGGTKEAGDCTQMGGSGDGLCTSTPCVRCRACAHRATGLKTNYRQTESEYRWLSKTFHRPIDCWPYADENRQMDTVKGYDYDKYPLRYWSWDHDLAWYYSQPVEEEPGDIYISFDRVIGGDGMVKKVITAEGDEYYYNPVTLTVREEGFLVVEPDTANAGDIVTARTFHLDADNVEIPDAGVTIKQNDVVMGQTDENGELDFEADP